MLSGALLPVEQTPEDEMTDVGVKVNNGSDSIILKAYAKINLSLEVIGRRDDGYHNIRSLMQGIGLYDVIKITKCPQNGTKYNFPNCTIDDVVVYLCTDAKTIPADMSNLAFRGIKAVLDKVSADPVRMQGRAIPSELTVELDKRLPVAAGIAGGSGNAAACMLGLNQLLGSPFSLRELMECGARVGADVPFSLLMNAKRNAGALAGLEGLGEASTAAWISGIGDIVVPAEPIRRRIIMANPGISVSTRDAYEAIDAIHEASGHAASDLIDPAPLFVNDLEDYTLNSYPEAANLRAFMKENLNADTVLMSGSGPTMIAYYQEHSEADSDFAYMKERAEKEWRIWLTETGSDEA